MRAFLAVAALSLLAVPASVFAANPQRQNPYANLFKGRLGSEQTPSVPQPSPVPVPDAAPKFMMPQASPLPLAPAVIVRCGMTIIHGNATIDPKILTGKPPAPNDLKPVIGIKPAPACQE